VQCPPVTEAVKIGDAIVLRTTDAACRSQQVIIKGKLDPMRLQLSGTRYRILAVTVQPWAKEQIDRKDMFSPVHVFVRTDGEVTIERAREVLAWAQKITTAPDIAVVLRNDASFAMQCDFPLVLPFVKLPVVIPPKSEFLNTKQVYCGKLAAWPIQCY
jgi:hypothetical protein